MKGGTGTDMKTIENKRIRRSVSLLLLVFLLFSFGSCHFPGKEGTPSETVPEKASGTASDTAVDPRGETPAETAVRKACAYLTDAVPTPLYGQAGGEWLIIGIMKSGASLSGSARAGYLTSLEDALREGSGSLSARRYTEYARAALALTALGENPGAFRGWDILAPLKSFSDVSKQGVNGIAYALIALDAADAVFSDNGNDTRQAYIDALVCAQRKDGGWSMNTNTAAPDADVTAMAIQALAPYTGQTAVSGSVRAGLAALGRIQNQNGTFSSYGAENAESCAQVLLALSALPAPLLSTDGAPDISSVIDALLSFAEPDGSFSHTADGETNLMSTEQALYALSAYLCTHSGK